MLMKRLICVLLVFCAVGTVYVGANVLPNTVCPVMPGHTVRQKLYVDYQGQRIYLCCGSCVRAFKKHPERYLRNLENADSQMPSAHKKNPVVAPHPTS